MNKCGTARGFTLIELLTTMLVAGILLALAVPSFLDYIRNNRLSGQASSLLYSLSYARSEAIKRNKLAGIQVCVSSTGAGCTGGAWSSGWVVVDPVAPQVLQAVPALSNSNTASGTVTPLVFNPDGSASAAEVFMFCDSRGPGYAREIEVNTLGRIQAAQTPGLTVNGTPVGGC